MRGAIDAAAKRLIAFEMQLGPFAVAQLRLLAEIAGADGTHSRRSPELRLFVTDTLGNPFVEEETARRRSYEPIAKSRRDANKIKREEPITVVIGNPPYKEKAKGAAAGSRRVRRKARAPLDRWMPPPEWGVGAHGKHLSNLYVYFWRWATWKVFGSGQYAATGDADKDGGIVCFITVAGFLNGPGFQKMRDYLRRDLRRHLGHRLLARRPSAGGQHAHLPGRAAARLHRARRAHA